MGKHQTQETPETCPVCGEEVPRRALACPECGADHNSGWREGAEIYDGLDLPEEFDQEEFGGSAKPGWVKTIWWLTAAVLIALTVLYLALSR